MSGTVARTCIQLVQVGARVASRLQHFLSVFCALHVCFPSGKGTQSQLSTGCSFSSHIPPPFWTTTSVNQDTGSLHIGDVLRESGGTARAESRNPDWEGLIDTKNHSSGCPLPELAPVRCSAANLAGAGAALGHMAPYRAASPVTFRTASLSLY